MKCLLFALILLLTTFQHVHLWLTDCTYDNNTSHVEYICHSDKEASELLNGSSLHCNNHFAEIVKETVRIVTFHGCDYSKFQYEFELYQFSDLRTFNVSTGEIESLSDTMFQSNNRLENFIASHNNIRGIPTNFFVHTPELMEIDLSYNEIEQLSLEVFKGTRKMKTIRIAHNQIGELPSQLFKNLVDLEVLDVSHNHLESIESNLFVSNKKLRSLNLRSNPLVHLQCELLTTLSSYSLTISFNSLVELNTNCANEKKLLKSNVTISSKASIASALTIVDGKFEWVFNKTDYLKLRQLNFSHSDMKHIPSLLEAANTQLELLDLSKTSVAALNESTFQNFTNLKYLFLQRTNISKSQFSMFRHQTNLISFDLAHNNLTSIDFRLFGRIFDHLLFLHLEGNNLTEIDGVTRTTFPQLGLFRVSKNRFTCQYLASFLHQWQDLHIIDNPTSNHLHMNGIDCIHENSNTEEYQPVAHEPTCPAFENNLSELYAIKMLLIILITINVAVCLLLYLLCISYKCKPVRKLFKHWANAGIVNESISFPHSRLIE